MLILFEYFKSFTLHAVYVMKTTLDTNQTTDLSLSFFYISTTNVVKEIYDKSTNGWKNRILYILNYAAFPFKLLSNFKVYTSISIYNIYTCKHKWCSPFFKRFIGETHSSQMSIKRCRDILELLDSVLKYLKCFLIICQQLLVLTQPHTMWIRMFSVMH